MTTHDDEWIAAREYIARSFHGHYERLAPEFGYETRADSAVPFDQVPEPNRELMLTVAGHVMRDIKDSSAVSLQVMSGVNP